MKFIPLTAYDFSCWAAQVRLRHRLVIALVILSVVSALATYAALSRAAFGGSPATIRALSILDLVLLVMLSMVVAQRTLSIWARRKRDQVGARLHVRMISVFALMAAAPAFLVAMCAAIFFYFGVEAWFSNHVRTSINDSLEVAQAYLEEHKQVLRSDALAMADDLGQQAVLLSNNSVRLAQVISTQAYLRNLNEVVVFDGSGRILARSGLSISLTQPITDEMMDHARKGDVTVLVNKNDDQVRALVKLDNFIDTYLFVGRPVEAKVLAHMETTEKAVSEYKQLEGKRFGLQLTLSLIFVVVALLLLLSAVWFGMNFATRLVGPISTLIGATERLRAGDLSARVPQADKQGEDEIELLGRAFNRMASQLEGQRTDLVEANRQLDLRRRFTEAVLSGVSAGVIGLDAGYRINLMNSSAASLFDVKETDLMHGQSIALLSPEIHALMEAVPQGGRLRDGQVEIRRPGKPTRTLLVRISDEKVAGETRGYVVTFDDVSDLVSAQRKAAWADVARRIAHEIKNPLTPIQLSAERLRRKYAKEIVTEPEVFLTCTDTIVRHVEDIGRMVDEFSAFARMPTPVIKENEVKELCRQTIFMQSTSRTDIRYTQSLPTDTCYADCDARQIAQALTNLLKNAAEAIDARPQPLTGLLPKGEIKLRLTMKEDRVILAVEDNGKGLPVEDRHNLTEPYVTTRAKGTGLGLAIVKKIMEDHLGEVTLDDSPGGGAIVRLTWPTHLVAQPNDTANAESINKDNVSAIVTPTIITKAS